MVVKSFVPRDHEKFEFIADLEVEFNGLILMSLEALLNLSFTLKKYELMVTINVMLTSFYGVIRICYVKNTHGLSW